MTDKTDNNNDVEEEFDIETWVPVEEEYTGDQSLHDVPVPREVSTLSESDILKEKYSRIEKNLSSYTVEQKKALKDQLILKAVEDARDNFYAYVLLMAPLTIPEDFVNGRHLKIICDSLQEVEQASVIAYQDQRDKKIKEDDRRQAKRVQYFLPPGGMKSLICSRLFPSWCFGRHPNWRFLQFGHGTDFAITNFGRPLKELLLSPEFKQVFPEFQLKKDARKAQEFETTKGGTYFCAGAGSSVAGKRATIAICDDVLSEQTAFSKPERDKVNKWYTVGPRQRLSSHGGEVLVNTRWHVDDLSGSRLKADGEEGIDKDKKKHPRPWKVFRFEAILSKKGADLLGLQEGGSFWPELWPKNRLLEFKNDPEMPPSRWNALYMQNPTPEEGNIVKHEQWQKWTYRDADGEMVPPNLSYVVISLDTAFEAKTSADFSAYTVWGIFQRRDVGFDGKEHWASHMILLHADKGRWEFPELCTKVEELRREWRPDLFIIEKKGSGQSLIQELRRRSFPIFPYLPDKDKVTRLHACTGFFHAGKVWIPEGFQWAKDVVDEVCGFPYAPNDDYTDTVSQCILWMRDAWKVDGPGYPEDEEEDENLGYLGKKKRGTYWSNVAKDE